MPHLATLMRALSGTQSNQPGSPNQRTDEGKDDHSKTGCLDYRNLRHWPIGATFPVWPCSATICLQTSARRSGAALLLQLDGPYRCVDAVARDAAFGFDLPL